MRRVSEKLTPADCVILVSLVLCAALLFALPAISSGKRSGYFTVSVREGGEEIVREYPLTGEYELHVLSDGFSYTVTVGGGSVWVSEADCANRFCVKKGKISSCGDGIVCIPGRLVIKIGDTRDTEDGYDCVVG